MRLRAWIAAIALVALVLPTAVPAPATAQTAPAPAPMRPEPTGGEVAGSVASNFFYAPGKFFTCVGGSVLWVVSMAITFGTIYDDAARLFDGACGGRWTVDDADIRKALEPVQGSGRADPSSGESK